MGVAPPFAVTANASLAAHTTLELGGPARALAEARTAEDLQLMLRWSRQAGWPVLLLGGGSNLVVGDAGFDGLAIKLSLRGRRIDRTGDVWAAAGEGWDELVEVTTEAGLAGFECLSGIPGSVGATPIQNVGAYGREIAELLTEVRVLDRHTGTVAAWPPEACEFGYRDSRFKREPDRWVVLSARFCLEPGAPPRLRYPEVVDAIEGPSTPASVRRVVLAIRRRKSMVLEPLGENRRSVGSFFTNPVVSPMQAEEVANRAVRAGVEASMPRHETATGDVKLSAAWLIERAGWTKGHRRGPVGISSRHCLALVHHGGGSTAALLELAGEIRDRVEIRFGVRLVPEPRLIGCALPPSSPVRPVD